MRISLSQTVIWQKKEIERLREEKEWLITEYTACLYFNTDTIGIEEGRERVLNEMQQALKEVE